MNLGSRRLRDEELRAHLEAIGLTEVKTFRASGNVPFSAEGIEEEELQNSWRPDYGSDSAISEGGGSATCPWT